MENKGKTWSRGTNSRLPFFVNVNLDFSSSLFWRAPFNPQASSKLACTRALSVSTGERAVKWRTSEKRREERRENPVSILNGYLSSAQYPARFLKNRFTYQNVKGAVLEGFTRSICLLDTARTTRSHWLSVEVNSQNWPINFFLDPLSPPSCKLPWILAIFLSRAAIERGRDVSNVSGTQDASKLNVT